MIRILVADDHPLVRRGLMKILADDQYPTALDEACSADEVLAKVSKNDYDAIVLDIVMPGNNSLEILKRLKTLKPKLPILVLSTYPEELYAVKALKGGALGYLSKDRALAELMTAVQSVLRGKTYLSDSLAESLAGYSEENSASPHEILSNREFQVMCMIAQGKTRAQIAQQLSLSTKTIAWYRESLLQKMKMKTNAELTHYAVLHHLIC